MRDLVVAGALIPPYSAVMTHSVYICNLADMPRHVSALSASHLISIITPGEMPATPCGIHPDNHLQVGCHDIIEPYPGAVHPGDSHVEAVIAFAQQWDRRAPLVVHCWAGVSRSTAAALTVACVHCNTSELAIAKRLRGAAPHAQPNELIVAIADRLLNRKGALIAAVQSIGFGNIPDRAPLVELNLDF